MVDEQGPWWTRPPEPGPQAPAVQRRRGSRQQDVDEPTVGYARPKLVKSAPEPEREPEPSPPEPVVRRIAVVPPTPPPVQTVGRDSREERTELLPPVSDDIFATFSGPLPQGTDTSAPARGVTQQATELGDAGEGPVSSVPNRLSGLLEQVKLPEPRVMLLGAAAGLVALLIVVVALISGRGPNAAQAARTPAANPSAVAGVSAFTGKAPDGLKQIGAVAATAQLRRAGQNAGGSIVEAWGWNDKNGRNLVVTTITGAGSNKRTLKVIHVAGLDGKPRTLRVMRDPNLPANCSGTGTAGFTSKSLIVRDLDGNNVAEVISGWTSRCGGKQAESQIKLALLTNGKKYILRGQGVVGQAGTFTPDPVAAKWPDNYLKMLGNQYRKLYG